VPVAGPHDPAATTAAWNACWTTWATWLVPNPAVANSFRQLMDCRAAAGWISGFLSLADRTNPEFQSANGRC
jgi:hypothetical protein